MTSEEGGCDVTRRVKTGQRPNLCDIGLEGLGDDQGDVGVGDVSDEV